jgi:hypothetical protein
MNLMLDVAPTAFDYRTGASIGAVSAAARRAFPIKNQRFDKLSQSQTQIETILFTTMTGVDFAGRATGEREARREPLISLCFCRLKLLPGNLSSF